MRNMLKPSHRSAARVLGFGLTLGPDYNRSIAEVWSVRLTRMERCSILAASIAACNPDDAMDIMDAACRDLSAAYPLPPLNSFSEQAKFWSSLAPVAEKKSYLSAIFMSLTGEDQSGFLSAASRRLEAA